jgi:hypothetical protein
VQRARLRVVQDPDGEGEREGRGVPELEKRPGDCDAENDFAAEPGDLAAAGVRFGNDLLQVLEGLTTPWVVT